MVEDTEDGESGSGVQSKVSWCRGSEGKERDEDTEEGEKDFELQLELAPATMRPVRQDQVNNQVNVTLRKQVRS